MPTGCLQGHQTNRVALDLILFQIWPGPDLELQIWTGPEPDIVELYKK